MRLQCTCHRRVYLGTVWEECRSGSGGFLKSVDEMFASHQIWVGVVLMFAWTVSGYLEMGVMLTWLELSLRLQSV